MTQDERDPVALGAELRRRREAAGQTQEAVAKEIGTTQQTIDRIERGETRHSRFLLPLQMLWQREEARDKADEAERQHLLSGGQRPEIPVFEWRAGRIAGGTRERVWAPDPFRKPLSGYLEGYGVRLLSPVASPSGDPVFQPGDILFATPDKPARHNGWVLLVSAEDAQAVRIGILADPAAMPPKVTREQLEEWGFLIVDEAREAAHPVLAFYAG